MLYIPAIYCNPSLHNFFWIKLKLGCKKVIRKELICIAIVFYSIHSNFYVFSRQLLFMRKYRSELISTRLILNCG